MSKGAEEIEKARRAYVAALGTPNEHAKRRELVEAIDATRAAQPATKRTA